MKTIKLKKLIINNFKGVKYLEIDFSDNTTFIFGRNATGKTSIMDAYLWLLFGKNSEDAKEFGIKPIDTNGEPIHNINVEVEGIFEENEKTFVLKRVLKEKWQRKRGSEVEEFVGNETEFFIDGINVSATKYAEFISSIEKEKYLKIITDPFYFSQKLSWQERRIILLEAINSYELENEIREKYRIPIDVNTDTYKKQLKQQANAKKNKISEYPVRISELNNQISERFDTKALEKEVANYEKQITELEQASKAILIQNEEKLKEYNEKLNELNQLKIQLQNEENKLTQQNIENKRKYENDKLIKQELESKIQRNENELENLKQQLNELRAKYKEIAERKFSFDNTNCETCGQPLPQLLLLERQKNGEEKFFEQKRNELQNIEKLGKSIKEQIQTIESFLVDWKKQLNELILIEPQQLHTNEVIEKLKTEIENFIVPEAPKIETSDIEKQKKEIYNKIVEIKNKINIENNNKTIENRIKSLEEEWRENGKQLTEIEKELVNLENFEIELARQIEENSIIDENLKFKMFRQLINGYYEPCCELLVDEVPFSDANHSGKIKSGIKVIEFLTKKLELKQMPIWIDNAEAINDLPEVKTQLIALYVTNDKKLIVKH